MHPAVRDVMMYGRPQRAEADRVCAETAATRAAVDRKAREELAARLQYVSHGNVPLNLPLLLLSCSRG